MASLPRGAAQRERLCGRGHDDLIADAFCAENAPRVTSLVEALAAVRLYPQSYRASQGFAVVGNSAALGKRSVSAINPRVIFVQLESEAEALIGVAFARGEPLIELVVRDRTSHELSFYVLAFTLACSDSHTCGPADLLTPAVESDWQSTDLYDESDFANTTFDCAVCHQPEGPGTPKLLRMHELEPPWTHWFDRQSRGGRALFDDFAAAHGDEPFAGMTGSRIADARAGLAAAFVRTAGYASQPLEFPSATIENEVEASAPGQPADNRVSGTSATWQSLYDAAQRGEAIPVPYHDVKLTDPDKLARMQDAYTAYRRGDAPASALPDIRDVYPDDPVLLAEMGFTLDERLGDAQLLTAACSTCHNERLDPSLTRARFQTDLARLSADEKALAIERLRLPAEHPLAMPPRRFLEVSEAARERLIALLGG